MAASPSSSSIKKIAAADSILLRKAPNSPPPQMPVEPIPNKGSLDYESSAGDSAVSSSQRKSIGPIGSQIYPFGLPNDIASCSEEIRSATAKLLLQRLQHGGSRGGYGSPGTPGSRRHTGGSSDFNNSLASTPSGSLASLSSLRPNATVRYSKGLPDRASLSLKDAGDLVLKTLHSNDFSGMEKLLSVYCRHFPIAAQAAVPSQATPPPHSAARTDSIGSVNTLKDFATRAARRKSVVSFGGGGNLDAISTGTQGSMPSAHHTPASNQPSNVSRQPCIFQNTLHVAIVHNQTAMVDLLLRSGLDPNSRAICFCNHSTATSRKPSVCPIGPGEPIPGTLTLRPSRAPFCLSCTCQSLANFNIVDLTPLEVAVKVRNSDAVASLCQAGAVVNCPNFITGNTPLLETVKDSPLNWGVVETLLLYGAKIHLKNLQNVCPADLAPELARFQTFCVEELAKIASGSEGNKGNFALKFSAEPRPEHTSVSRVPSRKSQADGISRANSSYIQSPRPSAAIIPGLKSPLAIGLTTIQQSIESPSATSISGSSPVDKMGPWNSNIGPRPVAEPSVNSIDASSAGRAGSSASAAHSHSNSPRKKSVHSLHRKFTKGNKDVSDSSHSISVDQAWASLVDMAINCETTMAIEIALLKQVSALGIIRKLRHRLKHLLSKFTSKKESSMEEFDENPYLESERKAAIVQHLCPMIKFCLHILQKGGSWFQFTAMSTLNKDVQISPENEPLLGSTAQNCQSSHDLLQTFKQIDPGTIITVLHNVLTLEKRIIGAKAVCSPSHRWRQCAYHCTQILCGRLLLFLCHLNSFRKQLADPQNARVLTQEMDPTYDPQLLCLLLQSIALLAMETKTHALLRELQIDDLLIQMLLPADDWYYTNHSTKFGQFVKHHAARILIYIGLGDRVGSRVNLFQFPGVAPEEATLPMALYPTEDEYICKTCSTPVMGHSLLGAKAFSLEGILAKILTELCIGAKKMKSRDDKDRKRSSEATLTGETITFHNLEAYLTRLACIVEPVILLRVILHKLSWDLGLVRKKQSVSNKLSNAQKVNTLMPVPFKKSKSFDRRADRKRGSSDSMHNDGSLCPSRGSTSPGGHRARLKIRRTSSLKILPVTSKEKLKGDSRDKRVDSVGSRASPHIHLPKYIQNLFRNRTHTIALPLKAGMKKLRGRTGTGTNSVAGSGSDSDAVVEFQKRLQNFPVSRKAAVGRNKRTKRDSGDEVPRCQSNQE